MISINTNLAAFMATQHLSKSADKIAQAIERLSTGYKVNHASDNAAGISIATSLSTKISSLMQVQNNTEDGINLLATAQGALENIDNLLDRLRNLSMQGMNGTYDEKSRRAMQEEANAIVAQIRSIRENTQFNGVKLFESASTESVLASITQTQGVNKLANSVQLNQSSSADTSSEDSQSLVTPKLSSPKRTMAKSAGANGLRGASSEPIEGAVDFAASETKTVTIDGVNYTIKNRNASANSLSYSKDSETGGVTFMCNYFTITGQDNVQHNIAISGRDNYVYGGNLDDTLKISSATSLNNYLYGQGGNDTLINTIANNYTYLYGGAGDDTFSGGGSYTYMYGNDGADTFNVTRNSTYLEGNAGNDIINITASSCTAYGSDGDDTSSITGSSNKVYGSAGEDSFTINSGSSNRVDGGAGTNSITDNGTNSTTINVPGANTVITAESFAKGETKTIDIDGISYTVTNNNSSTASFSYDIENDGRINFKSAKFKIVGQEDVAHKVRLSASNISFYGGELNDNIIIANVTSVSAYGKGGDDSITLGGNYAFINAGDGNDNITVTSSYGTYSQIFAGAGDDTLTMSSGGGQTYINMGAGDDTVIAGSKYQLAIDGGIGNNTYTGTGNNVTYGFDEETDKLSESIYLGSSGGSQTIEINGVSYTVTGKNGYDSYISYGYDEVTGVIYFGGRYTNVTGQSDASHNVCIYGYGVNFYGGDENDTIYNYGYASNSYGQGGNDKIYTYSVGGATASGGNGDDYIYLGNAAKVLGESGDDTININVAHTSYAINGGAGNDTYQINHTSANITDTTGNNVYYLNKNGMDITGGTGNDTFYVNGNNNTVHGGAGDDYFVINDSNNTVDGGTGNDYYVDNSGSTTNQLNVTIDPNSGFVAFTQAGETREITVGDKTFTITNTGASGSSTASNQVSYSLNTNTGIVTFEGSDVTIQAPDENNNVLLKGSNNLFLGGSLTDIVNVESGSGNVLNGMEGDDILTTDSANNSIIGGSGNDTINLNSSTTMTVDAGSGNNILNISSSNNTDITAGDGNNTIKVTGTNNTIDIGDGNNTISLNSGSNTVTAGDGDNTIKVASSSNNVIAGDGDNTLGISGNNNTVDLSKAVGKVVINGNNNEVNISQSDNIISIKGSGNTYTSQTGDRNVDVTGDSNNIQTQDGDDSIVVYGSSNTISTGAGSDTITVKGSNNNIDTTSGSKKTTIVGDNNTYEGSSDEDNVTISGNNNTANGNDSNDTFMISKGSNNTVNGGGGDRNTVMNNGTNTSGENVLDITPRPFELGVKVDTGSDSNSFVNVSISFNLFDFELDFMTENGLVENLQKIDDLRAAVSEQLVDIGSAINRLEYAMESQSTKLDNMISSLSTIRDADIAKVSAELIRQQILQQAAATLMSTANQTPAIALQLI